MPSDHEDSACPSCGGRVERGPVSALGAKRVFPPSIRSDDPTTELNEEGWCVGCGAAVSRKVHLTSDDHFEPDEPWHG